MYILFQHSVSCLTAPMSQYSTHSVTISVAPVDGDASLQSTGKVDFTYTVKHKFLRRAMGDFWDA